MSRSLSRSRSATATSVASASPPSAYGGVANDRRPGSPVRDVHEYDEALREVVATARSSKPSPLKSPAAAARALASVMRCAGIPAMRCAMLNDASCASLLGISSSAPAADDSDACAREHVAGETAAARQRDRRRRSAGEPAERARQAVLVAGRRHGAARRRRRIEAEWHLARERRFERRARRFDLGARFVTVIVHVAGASSVTGFGATLIVDGEVHAARGQHVEPHLPRHGVLSSATVNATVCVPTLRRSAGVPVNRPAALRVRPRGSATRRGVLQLAGRRIGVRDERSQIQIEWRALGRGLLGDPSDRRRIVDACHRDLNRN